MALQTPVQTPSCSLHCCCCPKKVRRIWKCQNTNVSLENGCNFRVRTIQQGDIHWPLSRVRRDVQPLSIHTGQQQQQDGECIKTSHNLHNYVNTTGKNCSRTIPALRWRFQINADTRNKQAASTESSSWTFPMIVLGTTLTEMMRTERIQLPQIAQRRNNWAPKMENTTRQIIPLSVVSMFTDPLDCTISLCNDFVKFSSAKLLAKLSNEHLFLNFSQFYRNNCTTRVLQWPWVVPRSPHQNAKEKFPHLQHSVLLYPFEHFDRLPQQSCALRNEKQPPLIQTTSGNIVRIVMELWEEWECEQSRGRSPKRCTHRSVLSFSSCFSGSSIFRQSNRAVLFSISLFFFFSMKSSNQFFVLDDRSFEFLPELTFPSQRGVRFFPHQSCSLRCHSLCRAVFWQRQKTGTWKLYYFTHTESIASRQIARGSKKRTGRVLLFSSRCHQIWDN